MMNNYNKKEHGGQKMQFIDLHRQFDRIEEGVREGFDAVLKHKGFIGGKEIKEAADYITTDVNDNGLYNAFKYLKLI